MTSPHTVAADPEAGGYGALYYGFAVLLTPLVRPHSGCPAHVRHGDTARQP